MREIVYVDVAHYNNNNDDDDNNNDDDDRKLPLAAFTQISPSRDAARRRVFDGVFDGVININTRDFYAQRRRHR